MEKLRVGIDFRGAQTSGERGIGRYATDLVLGLLCHASKVEVVLFVKPGAVPDAIRDKVKLVVVPANYWNGPNASKLMQLLHRPRLKFIHQTIFHISMQSQQAAMEKALRQNSVDILHIVSALDVGSYPIYRYPCPTLMTFLDAIVIAHKETIYDLFPTFLKTYFQQQVQNLAKADRIIAISEASKLDAISYFGLPSDRIDVIYPIVSDDFGRQQPRPNCAPEGDYFVFCSSPDAHKNPFGVLRAFAKLQANAHLVFVSPTSHPASRDLLTLAADIGVADRFIITGYVTEPDLIGLIQHAVAVVSPSSIEGFGLPVAQAMRAGTAVITSNQSAQAEIAAGVGVLVHPTDVDALATAMKSILTGTAKIDTKAGMERASNFDAKAVTGQLIEIYQTTIAERRTSFRG